MAKKLSKYTQQELLKALFERNDIQRSPMSREFVSPHVGIMIGIGFRHTVDITIDEHTLTELFGGEEWKEQLKG